ncbi:MAG TPA: ethylbenzene dehydrogenase-related protein [Candidatus Margulisiibacteriota bacterium]|nr:ethylbenzene dehydrogenase-related protein [Candidatus Margulisiibacteriota bacterium]
MTHRRIAALAVIALLVACKGPPPAPPAEVIATHRASVPSDPNDPVWRDAPVYTAALVAQDMVEPRLMEPSTDKVQVRALSDGKRIVFRLEWPDPTDNEVPGLARFSDACAVQLPVSIQADVPAPQMGESQRPVEITYWRAFWQSMVDGREDTIKALFPNATVDHYPFEAASLPPGSEAQREMAQRYAPARALGNDMAGPRTQPVQDLLAEGPGTIRPASESRSTGRGLRTEQGWTVVLARPLPNGLEPGGRTQVAFAVWQGAHQEAGARKMRSVWVPLLLQK